MYYIFIAISVAA